MTKYMPHEEFGQTRLVEVKVYVNAKYVDGEPIFEKTLWIERGEDWYAFANSDLKDKRVRVILRDDWIRSRVV